MPYDANNNLTGTVDANGVAGSQPVNAQGNTQSRQYDELNRLIQTTDAFNGTTRTVSQFYSAFLPKSKFTEPALDVLFFSDDLVGGRLNNTLPDSLSIMGKITNLGTVSATTSSILNSSDSLTGGSVTNFFSGTSASGGFVLYPNKPNTNMLKSVYKK